MTRATIVTDPAKLRELEEEREERERRMAAWREEFRQEGVSATFADVGKETAYQIVFDLQPGMKRRQAATLLTTIFIAIGAWLQRKGDAQTAWSVEQTERTGKPVRPRGRLPCGELRPEARQIVTPSSSPTEPMWTRSISFEGKLMALSDDPYELDQDLLSDMREAYQEIVCAIGTVEAVITVGTHRERATMTGNVARFTQPQLTAKFTPAKPPADP